MSRVKSFSLLVVGAFCLSNCSLWQTNEVSIHEETPAITLTNFEEIKEQQLIDEYGFKQRLLVEENTIKRNESIYTILSGFDVTPQTIYAINNEAKGVFRTNSLRPGQRYLVYKNPITDQVDRLIIHFDKVNYVVFDWADKIWVDRGAKEVSTIQKVTSGVITSSLYQSLKDNEVNPLLGSKLSEIFAWQVDFFSLQPNDQFTIVYEQPIVDGEPYGIGDIVAASFTHKGKSYDAFFYETDERAGYFDKNGNGLQKALLKAPFKYSQRVSSGFSHSRFHPVLKKSMPHYGVDYAAPIGTPVIAVGDGEVVEARYRGPNGNIVKIKHNGVYTTAYLHLNGFAPGVRRGVRVKQGQTIGYVGKTGRVTGVHLDYRIYKNDQPVNPLSIDLPASKSLAGDDLEEYKLYIERYKYLMRDELINLLASND
ncbi:MAG: peptidoglycan DD-metalloendopeptidase family protein [Balneolaceae bacterium]|nr:peptidoglycan DD-metalloendopeptidase family protein [Balneolaceae bacterium]